MGPGPEARQVSRFAVPFGLGAAVAVFAFGDQLGAFSGYGVGIAAGMVGLLIPAVLSLVAERLPRSIKLRCKSCEWHEEFVIE